MKIVCKKACAPVVSYQHRLSVQKILTAFGKISKRGLINLA